MIKTNHQFCDSLQASAGGTEPHSGQHSAQAAVCPTLNNVILMLQYGTSQIMIKQLYEKHF